MSNLLDMIVSNDEAVFANKKEPPKKIKVKKAIKPASDDEKESEEFVTPTPQEIQEAQKPSNVPVNNSIRSKKRKQHKILEDNKKARVDLKMHLEIAAYLKKWKFEKEDWKYQKARQIFLQKFILDQEKVIEEIWEIALEYISATQGNGKEILVKLCKSVIENIDAKCDKTEDKALLESHKYQRAREVLQNLQ